MSESAISPGASSRLGGHATVRRRVAFFAAVLAVAALPMVLTGSYWQTNLTVCAINVLLALGLDFVLGYTGQLNLG